MGDGKIFLKILRDTFFNKDLSNEPNFSLIHLAGIIVYGAFCKSAAWEMEKHGIVLLYVLFDYRLLTNLF
jgi:hypothetical protein